MFYVKVKYDKLKYQNKVYVYWSQSESYKQRILQYKNGIQQLIIN